MSRFKKLSHTIYECKYHVVFCPKYRYPIFDGKIGEYAKQQVYHLARQKDKVEVEEINVQAEHEGLSVCKSDHRRILVEVFQQDGYRILGLF